MNKYILKTTRRFLRLSLFWLPKSAIMITQFEVLSYLGRLITKRLRVNRGDTVYLNVGSGGISKNWMLNVDFFGGEHVDYPADLRFPLAINDACISGIFCEHTIEHLRHDDARNLIKEFYRILKPGGAVRIILPDISLFLKNYLENDSMWFDEWERLYFRESGDESRRDRVMSHPIEALSFVTQEYGHSSCWDPSSLRHALLAAGFHEPYLTDFRNGKDQKLLIDRDEPSRRHVSFYMEVQK